MDQVPIPAASRIAFVGGGNMASAIINGLLARGLPARQIAVLDPNSAARDALQRRFAVRASAHAAEVLGQVELLVWAVKPQEFRAAAAAIADYTPAPAQLSIMAGIRVRDIVRATATTRVVRCMPNTPALVGQGMSGLYASADADLAVRTLAESVMRSTGDVLWVEREEQLDAVTALSGSGPAYVFYFLEAMQQAGAELGLAPAQARQLAVQTFAGGAALARESEEPLATLRERVTSKGGTTYAALQALEQADAKGAFVRAMHAAHQRAVELGDEFGA